MAEDGDDKLIEVARHTAKRLGRTDTMADDIYQIFSTFDGGFSRDELERGAAGGGGRRPGFSTSPERVLRHLDRQISRFITSDRPIWSVPADSGAFLDVIDSLLAVAREIDGEKRLVDHAEDLLHQSMFRLRDEFISLIECESGEAPLDPPSDGEDSGREDLIPVAHPVPDYDIVIDALPSGSIADLLDIAKRMVVAGFGKECAHAYSTCRRDFVVESVSRLGLRLLTPEAAQGAPLPDVEEEIKRWTKAINVAVRILFPSERRLCDRVFAGLAPVADLSFAEACTGPAMQLLGFSDAVALGSRAPERLFGVLDVYEALRDLLPEIGSIFSDQHSAFIRREAAAVCRRLGAAIRGIFAEFENLIRRDPVKGAVQAGGGVHPLNRYVMNYLPVTCAYRGTLEEVMDEDEGAASPLSVQITWIVELLQGNLEAKSRVYKKPAQSCVFLVNNVQYIVQKVKGSELGPILGEDWTRKQAARVKQWWSSYQRSTWSKVVESLRVDGEGSPGSATSALAVQILGEKIRLFNTHFEEIYMSQTGWLVVDDQLRTEAKLSAIALVVPAYRKFLGVLRYSPESGKHVKYSAEDVEARISELLQGQARKL